MIYEENWALPKFNIEKQDISYERLSNEMKS